MRENGAPQLDPGALVELPPCSSEFQSNVRGPPPVGGGSPPHLNLPQRPQRQRAATQSRRTPRGMARDLFVLIHL
jgi:hypothetical protein